LATADVIQRFFRASSSMFLICLDMFFSNFRDSLELVL